MIPTAITFTSIFPCYKREDETFNTIHDIDDWDVYFSEKKEKLEERYETLREEYEDCFGTTEVE